MTTPQDRLDERIWRWAPLVLIAVGVALVVLGLLLP